MSEPTSTTGGKLTIQTDLGSQPTDEGEISLIPRSPLSPFRSQIPENQEEHKDESRQFNDPAAVPAFSSKVSVLQEWLSKMRTSVYDLENETTVFRDPDAPGVPPPFTKEARVWHFTDPKVSNTIPECFECGVDPRCKTFSCTGELHITRVRENCTKADVDTEQAFEGYFEPKTVTQLCEAFSAMSDPSMKHEMVWEPKNARRLEHAWDLGKRDMVTRPLGSTGEYETEQVTVTLLSIHKQITPPSNSSKRALEDDSEDDSHPGGSANERKRRYIQAAVDDSSESSL